MLVSNHTRFFRNTTERLSARPQLNLVRSSVVMALSLALAYGGGLWMLLLHQAEGAIEPNEPPAVIHWLRDSTFTLPVVILAVLIAAWLSRRLLERYAEGDASRLAPRLVLATVVAVSASAALVAAGPVHDAIFDAYRGGYELPLYLYLGRDFLLALVANMSISGLVCALLRGDPWARAHTKNHTKDRRFHRRLVVQGLTAALGLAVPLAALVVGSIDHSRPAVAQTAPATSNGACPANAAVKNFDVQAIDVDIPLNRFGDHDPKGKMYVLSKDLAAVRAEEKSQKVSLGLREDAIQPLIIRANEGDCVKIHFTNNASGGAYGVHIDGLAFDANSSGDQIGANASSAVARGGSRNYTYFVPVDPTAEGDHYIRPGPGNRDTLSHGLFGSLTVEPPGSTYASIETGKALDSGWQASIMPGAATTDPGDDKPAFREYVQIYHEIGNEKDSVKNARGNDLPRVDPHTESYRPGTRAINYRSEPFMNRLDANPKQESLGYSSYTFGDPATPMPRSYQADPTKMRITHGGGEMFHVFHLHGGGIRWRFNPVADKTYDYADTGLNKHPKTQFSPSTRLDSQAIGPGESYNLEIEGGAGGVQQGAGEFLFHCHIAEHYISGMWSFWRVYDTKQPDLAPLPDRQPLPEAVDSSELIGKTINGTTITKDNLDDWIRPQLPAQGVPKDNQDASVWNWKIDKSDPNNPTYLGEPEEAKAWPDLPNADSSHPGAYPVDEFVGNRPKILFDPTNGRPAFPLLRTHVGSRPPFSGNGHSGAPYLGETGDQASNAPPGGADPWANRADGICPAGAPVRHYNVVAIDLPIQVTKKEKDPNGKIYVLAHNVNDVRAGRKPAEPLAIRGNIGDCIAVTLTSEQKDKDAADGFAKVNMHIHHVQFDTQASDGVITGLSYEQSVRPFAAEDPTLAQAASKDDKTLKLSSVAKFQKGVSIGVGLGTDSIEIHQIDSIDPATNTLTLKEPLKSDHPSGQAAGTEFVQYRWYPDVELDNIFWHDHVDGIHNWGHGLVGQFIVEPQGSTYHDPKTGEEIDGSGTYVDIHTTNPLASGLVDGSFRELALWEIDESPVTDSTMNVRAEPWADRGGDPSLRFSSYAHGDPNTPLPEAYPGDPFVIRTINVGPSVDTLHIDGHRFYLENRYRGPNGEIEGHPLDTLHYGVSERFTLMLQGGAGGINQKPGDYLYMNGIGRRFEQGAWGILRVLPGLSPDLQPLPGTSPPSGGALPSQTGGRPPAATDPGNPCPTTAPQHDFNVSAVDMPNASDGRKFAFVPGSEVAAVKAGKKPEPLALHVAAGECVTVNFKNESSLNRASFHVDKLESTPESSGVNVGFNPEQTVARGQSRTYRYYADSDKLGSAVISDFGGDDTGKDGLYGAVLVAPQGATFSDPVSGKSTDVGTQVDVHVPGGKSYRDFTLVFSDDDPIIGGSFMPYPISVSGPALVNYGSAPLRDDSNGAFSGDPKTPILRAHTGDPVTVHAIGAPDSEQMHVFSLGGLSWNIDSDIIEGDRVESRALGPWESIDADAIGGAGGEGHTIGDYFYGDLRRPFTQAGLWGLMRVLPASDNSIKPLDSGGVQPPQDPGSGLSLNAASSTLDFGESTTLSGKLTDGTGDPLSGEDVTLEQRPSNAQSFTQVAGAQSTGPDGSFSFTGIKPTGNTDYRASFAGDQAQSLEPSVSSTERVNVKALVSIRTAANSLKLGKTQTISGAVVPAHKGAVKLTLQQGKKVVLRKSVPLSKSHYTLRYSPTAAGSYKASASFAGDADHLGGKSQVRRFKVLR